MATEDRRSEDIANAQLWSEIIRCPRIITANWTAVSSGNSSVARNVAISLWIAEENGRERDEEKMKNRDQEVIGQFPQKADSYRGGVTGTDDASLELAKSIGWVYIISQWIVCAQTMTPVLEWMLELISQESYAHLNEHRYYFFIVAITELRWDSEKRLEDTNTHCGWKVYLGRFSMENSMYQHLFSWSISFVSVVTDGEVALGNQPQTV